MNKRTTLRPIPWWVWALMVGQYALSFVMAAVWWPLSPVLSWSAAAELIWASARQARWVGLQRSLRRGVLYAEVVVERPALESGRRALSERTAKVGG